MVNETDRAGIYCYERQPPTTQHACARLAEVLQPSHCEPMHEFRLGVETTFDEAYEAAYLRGMRQRLGFAHVRECDGALVRELLDAMHAAGMDWILTWAELETAQTPVTLSDWAARHAERLAERAPSAREQVGALPRRADVEAAVEASGEGSFP